MNNQPNAKTQMRLPQLNKALRRRFRPASEFILMAQAIALREERVRQEKFDRQRQHEQALSRGAAA